MRKKIPKKSLEELSAYFNEEVAEFLYGLYEVIDEENLLLHGWINEDDKIGTIEQIVDSLKILVPKKDIVLEALAAFNQLPKDSVHQKIKPSHVFKYPNEIVKLAENYKPVLKLVTSLDELDVTSFHWFDGAGNFILEYLDKILEVSKYQDTLINFLKQFPEGIQIYFNNSMDLLVDRGLIDSLDRLKDILNKKEQYFSGLHFLMERGLEDSSSKPYHLFNDIMENYESIIKIGENQELQKFIDLLLNNGLLKEYHFEKRLTGKLKEVLKVENIVELEKKAPYMNEIVDFVAQYTETDHVPLRRYNLLEITIGVDETILPKWIESKDKIFSEFRDFYQNNPWVSKNGAISKFEEIAKEVCANS